VTAERIPRPTLLGLAALVLIAGAARWATRSTAFDQMDVVFFVRGVVDYSVDAQRPHFPGYPVFIWAGKAAQWLFPDPLEAVHAVAVAASTLIAVPLALLAAVLRQEDGVGSGESRRAALAAAAIWLVVPGSWITGGEGFSDSLGLLFATLALWCVGRAWGGSPAWSFVAGALGGLTLGVRLVCVTLLGPLAVLVLRDFRAPGDLRRRTAAFLGLVAGCVPWIAWQFWRDGWGLVRAGRRHLFGHFGSWGESALTDAHVWTRPLRLLRTVLVHGLGGGPLDGSRTRLVITTLFVVLGVAGAVRLWRRGGHPAALFALWALGYAVYATYAHDVEYPRYSLPLTAAVGVTAALGLPRGWPGTLAVASLVGLVLYVTLPLALEHRRVPPTELQLARYMGGVAPPAVLLNSDVSLPMVYAFAEELAPRVGLAIAEPDTVGSLAAQHRSEGKTVYATIPDASRPEEWVAVACFQRSAVFDPRSAPEIWLFRHEPGAPPAPIPRCRPHP
jgi:4-amino-4-deoxy-L-arabinose transferase-like glycosyltransferase